MASFDLQATCNTHHRPPIDTTTFMSRYHHPKNVAAAKGNQTEGQWATIATAYSKAKGMYRQKQVDDEIERMRSFKKPSSSKITITIDSSNLMRIYHHHHHCLDIQLEGGRGGKGRVVWIWREWETATDERVMKGVIAAMDSSWSDPTTAKLNENSISESITAGVHYGKSKEVTTALSVPNAGEKRKLAAVAAESRARGRIHISKETNKGQSQKKSIEVVDLTE
mmetsp:Transcript_3732/g.7844  ORF Transcript_3732/g.7844 Transcript_3732/m.7844 type:complete len:224 (-) Transcript_3732:325-996(-)